VQNFINNGQNAGPTSNPLIPLLEQGGLENILKASLMNGSIFNTDNAEKVTT